VSEDEPKSFEIEIYLRCGHIVRAQIVRWKLKYNGLEQLTGVEWETPPRSDMIKVRQLSHIDVADIAAIVVVG
jgi:hypothetical protein